MKRILTIAVFIFSFMFVMAQTPNNHLTFKGIPITGTVESFVEKLVAKGLKKRDSYQTYVELEGEFAGYSECRIRVYRNPNRNVVYKVFVILPEENLWAILEKEYNHFKNMLTNKYGEPASHSETFKEGVSTFSGYAKMSSLRAGNCDYWAEWKVENGYIEVNIASMSDTYYGYIRLFYYDKINSALADRALEDDL